MNAKFWKSTLTLTGLAAVFIVYSGIQPEPVKNDKNAVLKTSSITPKPGINKPPEVETIQQQSFAESILSSAEAGVIETYESSTLDDKALGAIFDAEYEPVTDESGDFSGFRISISDETSNDISSENKLQNGDVVTQINNVRLDSEKSLAFAIAQLFEYKENATITFNIKRNGNDHAISLGYQP